MRRFGRPWRHLRLLRTRIGTRHIRLRCPLSLTLGRKWRPLWTRFRTLHTLRIQRPRLRMGLLSTDVGRRRSLTEGLPRRSRSLSRYYLTIDDVLGQSEP